MGDPKTIRRDQLARFIPDNETILRFQRLFEVAGTTTPEAIESITDQSQTGLSAAIEALGLISKLKQDLESDVASLQARVNQLSDSLELLTDLRDKIPADNSQHNFSNRDHIDFNVNVATQIDIPGRFLWNIDDGTMNLGLYNDVILQLGQESHYFAKNVSGGVIANGAPVMFAGTIGASGKLQIDLAQSDSAIPAEYFMGLATQEMADNDFGYVTEFGLVRGIDTTGTPVGEVWNDGDLLYLSTTAGQLTVTPPTAPDPKILVAAVVYSHAVIGSLFVRPTWGDYLSSLHDVYINSIADHDILEWNSANNRYENTSDPIVDTISVNDNIIMSGTTGEGIEVDITTPTFGWQDMISSIKIRGIAATDPTYAVYTGGIRGYQFGLNDIVWNEFHVLHDYVPSTDLYIHVHWSHASAAVTTGSVTWSFEITYAKGHDQAAFPATKTITVTQNGSTTQYQHMIAEVAFTAATADATHFDRDDIEIDGLVLVKTELTANSLNAATDPFVHFIDIHYQTTNIGSKNKAPNFYVT